MNKEIKNQMNIQPFRIYPSDDPDDFSERFEFIIFGSKGITKPPYQINIFIDRFNETGITNMKCTCPHFQYRGEEIEGKCKHILKAIEILKEYKIIKNED